mmetsp:Transcript_113/g.238  ORF Transcript_113/g.238 Transcript_113/m.238 type:complete len:381 (+) Transcript_113:44-1186(+)
MTYFSYDPTEHGFLTVTWMCSRAVFPRVLQKPGYWAFVILNCTLWACLKLDLFSSFGEMFEQGGLFWLDGGHLKIIGALLIFFEVLYTSQCYKRYFMMGTQVQDLFQTAMKCVLDHKVYFTKADPTLCKLLAKWLRGQLLLAFKELKHCRSGEFAEEHWEELQSIGAFSQQEVSILADKRMTQIRYTMLHWQMAVTNEADAQSPRGPPILFGIMSRIVHFHDAQRILWQINSMPVPYVYFHLVNSMISCQGFLGAISMAETPSIVGPISFSLSFALFVGMLEVAKAMSDPFGNGDVDYPLEDWFEAFTENNAGMQAQKVVLDDFTASLEQSKQRTASTKLLSTFLSEDKVQKSVTPVSRSYFASSNGDTQGSKLLDGSPA